MRPIPKTEEFPKKPTGEVQYGDCLIYQKALEQWALEAEIEIVELKEIIKLYQKVDIVGLRVKLKAAEKVNNEMMDMLDNIIYWETCPQEYKDRIKALSK